MSSSETDLTANETDGTATASNLTVAVADAPLAASTPKDSLNAIPRAGGYLKGLPSSNVISSRSSKSMNQTKSHTSMSVFYAKSRERRINLVLEESEWNFGESELEICTPDTLADNVLAVTISCVMLMAADVADIPEEYFTFAENYLSCIKDETNYHPPNVQGILNHIAYLRETTDRKRDPAKEETCKCDDIDQSAGCDPVECAKRSNSKIKFQKTCSNTKRSRCRIPVRKKACSPAK